jgi:alpha-beta hydrolase superfamily lysophospholipase
MNKKSLMRSGHIHDIDDSGGARNIHSTQDIHEVQEVQACQSSLANPETCWKVDLLPGFEQRALSGGIAPDGPLTLTLIRRRCSAAQSAAHPVAAGAGVLYIHGFADYFFQTHLADFYNEQGLHFYALDLRRHGRSLLAHQLPNFMLDIDEYLQDVDTAIDVLRGTEQVRWLMLNGHSTGGLVVSLYAHRGAQRKLVDAIFLNSPFLDMNLPVWQQVIAEPVLAWAGKWFPHWRLPVLSTVYGKSLHSTHHGQWQYGTEWKPIAGFPVYAGWFRAIHRAHAEVERGLEIACPCLLLHAGHSLVSRVWTEETMSADVVLDVADMVRLAPRLGGQVERHAITGGVHDLVLSSAVPREQVWQLLKAWLERVIVA